MVIDIPSGISGNGSRDKRMLKEILESQKYPEAVFTPRPGQAQHKSRTAGRNLGARCAWETSGFMAPSHEIVVALSGMQRQRQPLTALRRHDFLIPYPGFRFDRSLITSCEALYC